MTFSEQLKKEQQRLGLTQAGLAAFLDVSPRVIFDWLHDKPPLVLTQEGAIARLEKKSADNAKKGLPSS